MLTVFNGLAGCWQGLGQFTLEFEQQPLGRFFFFFWHLEQAPDFLPRDGLRQIAHR